MNKIKFRRNLAKVVCMFIPFKKLRQDVRRRITNRIFTITLDKVDSYLPEEVCKRIAEVDNDYFIEKNREVNGGKHFGYFDFDENAKDIKSPLNPWALIRVRNEIHTLWYSLESILPAVQRGIIGYNDCDDGSEEAILEFCKKYPSFKPVKYPYEVQIINPQTENNMFHTYCNYLLDFIPSDEWVIKFDADHIYHAQKLYKSFYIPKDPTDKLALSRVNFHIKDGEIYMMPNELGEYYHRAGDHWLVKRRDLRFTQVYWEGNGGTYETLTLDPYHRSIRSELCNFHFPLVKESRKHLFETRDHIRFKDWKDSAIGTEIDPAIWNEKYILEQYNRFNIH